MIFSLKRNITSLESEFPLYMSIPRVLLYNHFHKWLVQSFRDTLPTETGWRVLLFSKERTSEFIGVFYVPRSPLIMRIRFMLDQFIEIGLEQQSSTVFLREIRPQNAKERPTFYHIVDHAPSYQIMILTYASINQRKKFIKKHKRLQNKRHKPKPPPVYVHPCLLSSASPSSSAPSVSTTSVTSSTPVPLPLPLLEQCRVAEMLFRVIQAKGTAPPLWTSSQVTSRYPSPTTTLTDFLECFQESIRQLNRKIQSLHDVDEVTWRDYAAQWNRFLVCLEMVTHILEDVLRTPVEVHASRPLSDSWFTTQPYGLLPWSKEVMAMEYSMRNAKVCIRGIHEMILLYAKTVGSFVVLKWVQKVWVEFVHDVKHTHDIFVARKGDVLVKTSRSTQVKTKYLHL